MFLLALVSLGSIVDYWCVAETIAPQSEHVSIKRMEQMKMLLTGFGCEN